MKSMQLNHFSRIVDSDVKFPGILFAGMFPGIYYLFQWEYSFGMFPLTILSSRPPVSSQQSCCAALPGRSVLSACFDLVTDGTLCACPLFSAVFDFSVFLSGESMTFCSSADSSRARRADLSSADSSADRLPAASLARRVRHSPELSIETRFGTGKVTTGAECTGLPLSCKPSVFSTAEEGGFCRGEFFISFSLILMLAFSTVLGVRGGGQPN